MKRKVNKVGQNTLTVSLPSKWVEKYGIKKGQEIDMDEEKGKITIGIRKNIEIERMKIHLDSPDKFMRRVIQSPYKRGCDELEVTYSDPKVLNLITDVLSETIGFEIVKQGNGYILIKNVATGLEEEFDDIYERVFMIIKTMNNNIREFLKTEDENLLEETKSMETTIHKLTNFCLRQLYRNGYKNERMTMQKYCIMRSMERLSDFLFRQASLLSGELFVKRLINNKRIQKVRLNKEAIQICEKTIVLGNICFEMINKFHYEKLLEYRKKEVELKMQIFDQITSANGYQNVFLFYSLSAIDELTHITELLF